MTTIPARLRSGSIGAPAGHSWVSSRQAAAAGIPVAELEALSAQHGGRPASRPVQGERWLTAGRQIAPTEAPDVLYSVPDELFGD